MSALTLAKPPIATPATQRNSVVAPIVATQLPPNFEPVLEINLNPELAHEQNEQPTQSNQSSLVSASCLGDLNYDGNIDSEDLGIILGAFGCSIGCESDLNADGNVNSADLGVLLIQFGVCPAPTVTVISPASGLASGGTTITLKGTNFFGASSVTVGGVAATSVNVVSENFLTAVTPAGSIGSAVSVSVTTPGGTGTLAGAFSYSSSAPPTVTVVSPEFGLPSGGTTIIVNGTNFFGASRVTVGDALATNINVVSASVLTAVTPAGKAGASVSVSVTTPGGTGTLAGAFVYLFPWFTILEQAPNATVVPDAAVRAKISASGYPWRVRDNTTGIEMLLIPGGTFTMGCSASNFYGCNDDETNHQVTLSKAFYLGKTEVTQAQWQAKIGSNPSYSQPPNDTLDTSRPVEQVSWNDIAGFNTATGLRLPSEAEWEYACRGGTTTAFHSMLGYPDGTNDDNLLVNIAWYSNNSGWTAHAVGGKVANAFGIYDMSGNVYEWCNDWYGSYAASNATNPAGPSSGSYRVLRGGGWYDDANVCRSSYRLYVGPDDRFTDVGFRVARTPDFTPAPTVTAISPASGLTTGGTPITVNGTNFSGAISVTVGGVAATSVNVISATVLTAVTPAGSIGPAESVSVTTPGGTGTLASAFSYYEAGTPSWATVLEVLPDAAVVPDDIVRANIVASGLPWRVRDNSSGIEMLLIPGGTFTMGCSASSSFGCNSYETNHQVTLSKAFYLAKTEVTQAQWQAKMGSNPSYFSGNPNNPVEKVSWNDIAGFNTATGLRLPSEAEWEYACRGGTTTAFHSMPGYPNGTNDDSLLGNIAWYSSNNSPNGTKPVAGKVANAFGMYDMSGNVYEWCNDWDGSYAAGNVTDPTGPSVGQYGSYRVLRGGSWSNSSNICRSSIRINDDPGTRYNILGFRVARTP